MPLQVVAHICHKTRDGAEFPEVGWGSLITVLS